MIKYIVTGGAGFIGSHLVERLLKKNKKVIVIDNLSTGRFENIKKFKTQINFIKADISKKGRWQKIIAKNCCIFHLAAVADIVPSIKFPQKYFEELKLINGDKGARDIINRNEVNLNRFVTEDDSYFIDLDTPEDFLNWANQVS